MQALRNRWNASYQAADSMPARPVRRQYDAVYSSRVGRPSAARSSPRNAPSAHHGMHRYVKSPSG